MLLWHHHHRPQEKQCLRRGHHLGECSDLVIIWRGDQRRRGPRGLGSCGGRFLYNEVGILRGNAGFFGLDSELYKNLGICLQSYFTENIKDAIWKSIKHGDLIQLLAWSSDNGLGLMHASFRVGAEATAASLEFLFILPI